jgi:hypothetical protein
MTLNASIKLSNPSRRNPSESNFERYNPATIAFSRKDNCFIILFGKWGVGCIGFEICQTLRVIALPPHAVRRHLDALFVIAQHISLPEAQNPPAGVDQLSSVPKIARYVSEDFRNPILLVVHPFELGCETPESSSPPLVSVPEITIDKNGQLLEGKHEVWLSGEV